MPRNLTYVPFNSSQYIARVTADGMSSGSARRRQYASIPSSASESPEKPIERKKRPMDPAEKSFHL